eukprot:4010052-Pyramimonas_sp.AAC.1
MGPESPRGAEGPRNPGSMPWRRSSICPATRWASRQGKPTDRRNEIIPMGSIDREPLGLSTPRPRPLDPRWGRK